MNLMTPLERELNELNNPEDYEVIPHENWAHIALGVVVHGESYYFNHPVDVSEGRHNIIYDGEPIFKVAYIDKFTSLELNQLIGQQISIHIGETKQDLYISSGSNCYDLSFRIETFEDYMVLKLKDCNNVPDSAEFVIRDVIENLSSHCKVFETTIPVIDNEGNTQNEITTRVTAEVGLQFSFENEHIIICKPDLDMEMKGFINVFKIGENMNTGAILKNDELLNFFIKHKVRKSRDL